MDIPIPPKVMSFDYRVRIYRREVKGYIAQARQRVAELQALANAMHAVCNREVLFFASQCCERFAPVLDFLSGSRGVG